VTASQTKPAMKKTAGAHLGTLGSGILSANFALKAPDAASRAFTR
jgi:hypothetical protein